MLGYEGNVWIQIHLERTSLDSGRMRTRGKTSRHRVHACKSLASVKTSSRRSVYLSKIHRCLTRTFHLLWVPYVCYFVWVAACKTHAWMIKFNYRVYELSWTTTHWNTDSLSEVNVLFSLILYSAARLSRNTQVGVLSYTKKKG